VTNAPAQVVTEPANAKLAVGKKPKKVVPEFPAEGAAIPEDVRIMLSKFDLDGNGKMSLEEFNKLPPELKMPIRERLLLPPKTRASK
jgi:hypothetical protein